MKIKVYSRRSFILRSSSSFALLSLLNKKPNAHEREDHEPILLQNSEPNLYTQKFYTDLKKILNTAKPSKIDSFRLEIPEYAENGSIVPFKISLESLMTKDNFVKAFHILSTSNPNAWVASFHLTPECGKAQVSGRMRLAKTQAVYSLANLSNGTMYITEQNVEVLIGGCGMD